jgi:hypothetical protein
LFFNERFNFVAEGSTQIRVATAGDNAPPLAITNLKVPKNGFAYIYVLNEIADSPIPFCYLKEPWAKFDQRVL